MFKTILSLSFLAASAFTTSASASLVFETNGDLQSRGNTEYSFSTNGITQEHKNIKINFDLYIFDSWDGVNTRNGDDVFGFRVNGIEYSWTFLGRNSETFLNKPDEAIPQEYVRGAFNEYDIYGPIDRFYEDFYSGFVIPHTSESLDLVFFGTGLQAIHDESWGVANLRVETLDRVDLSGNDGYLLSDVSVPFTFGAFLIAFSCLLFRRK